MYSCTTSSVFHRRMSLFLLDRCSAENVRGTCFSMLTMPTWNMATRMMKSNPAPALASTHGESKPNLQARWIYHVLYMCVMVTLYCDIPEQVLCKYFCAWINTEQFFLIVLHCCSTSLDFLQLWSIWNSTECRQHLLFMCGLVPGLQQSSSQGYRLADQNVCKITILRSLYTNYSQRCTVNLTSTALSTSTSPFQLANAA